MPISNVSHALKLIQVISVKIFCNYCSTLADAPIVFMFPWFPSDFTDFIQDHFHKNTLTIFIFALFGVTFNSWAST